MQSDKPIASVIDHTLLKPEATQDQIVPSEGLSTAPLASVTSTTFACRS
jgi:deoxyribose-phosphate aldolase